MERKLSADWKIRVVRSKRKTLSISLREGKVILAKAPNWYTNESILRFIELKREWIERQFRAMEKERQQALREGVLTREEIKTLAEMAKKVLPQKVAHYAEILGVTYGRITIRSQKSLWGSCSAKGNLNFNCLLMLAPNEVIDYVVVHELCHRLEMNHSQKFWNHVRRIIPDYREKRRWLREEGNILMKRMTAGQFSS